jgi:DNA-binding transcriptional LysR family regulator
MTDALPFTLQQLRVFLTVAARGSITDAAADLGVTQPAVSQALRELERRLGSELVRRGSSPLELSATGLRFLEGAERILAACTEAAELLDGGTGPLSGTLAIGASTTIGNYVLPSIMGQFTAQNPSTEIQLWIGNSADVVHRVARRDIEFGFIEGRCQHPDIDVTEIATDHLKLVCRHDHPLAQLASVPVSALSGQSLILREPGSGTREVVENRLAGVGVFATARMCLGNTEAIKTAIIDGHGISLLSGLTVEREVLAGLLCAIPVTGVSLARPFYRLKLRRRGLGRLADRFADAVSGAANLPRG